MANLWLRQARQQQGWSQQQLADLAEVSLSTIERAERGEPIRVDSLERICTAFSLSPQQLGLVKDADVNRRQMNAAISGFVAGITAMPTRAFWGHDDPLALFARGIAACQDLYYGGHPHQVEALLPLYLHHTEQLTGQSGSLGQKAALLAAQANVLACELATDREDYGMARQVGQQALAYARLAGEPNLQVASLIELANLDWHLSSAQPLYVRRHSKDALQSYLYAVSLLKDPVTPLLRGRTYAGIAEVYALRGQFQEAMQAMGLAYEHFPIHPESDPAYPYVRASRYSLYVFGDAQSRLLLNQPKEAEDALTAMQKETSDPEIEPITKVDLLYYQAEACLQQREIERGVTLLADAARRAKHLGSRLYFNKLVSRYYQLEEYYPNEHTVAGQEDAFQPW